MASDAISAEDYEDFPDPPLPQRRRIKPAAVIMASLAAVALVVILIPKRNSEEPAAHTIPEPGTTETAPVEQTPSPDLTDSIAAEEPPAAPPEVVSTPPPALPQAVELADEPVPASESPVIAETPPPVPEIPSAPPLPDPEEGLVAAIPDTPGASVPQAPATPAADDNSVADSGDFTLHSVQPGETLGKIAAQHQVDVAEIQRLNRLQNDRLQAGQSLKIPSRDTDTGTADEASDEAPPVTEDAPPVTEDAPPVTEDAPPVPDAEPRRHTVVRGDTLTRIGRQYGCTPADIMRLNRKKTDVIRLGEELLIPPPAN